MELFNGPGVEKRRYTQLSFKEYCLGPDKVCPPNQSVSPECLPVLCVPACLGPDKVCGSVGRQANQSVVSFGWRACLSCVCPTH